MRAILLTLVLLSNCALFSQYHPIIQENKIWQIAVRYAEEGFHSESYRIIAYFKGDTLIDTTHYQKLYYQIFDKYIIGPPEVITDTTLQAPQLYAMLREDTATQQVFIYQDIVEKKVVEYLLYDFSLSVGDTIKTYVIGRGPKPIGSGVNDLGPGVIQKIDTIITEDGVSRKRLKVGVFSAPPAYFLEGIGGSNFVGGLINPVYFQSVSGFDYKEELICVRQGNQLVYGDCAAVAGIIKNESEQLKPFPNPSDGRIKLSGLKPGTRLLIMNALGQEVLVQKVTDVSVELDLRGVADGIYVIRTSGGSSGNFILDAR